MGSYFTYLSLLWCYDHLHEVVLWNIGEISLYRKNGIFWHKIELLRESTGLMMLKFGLEIDLWVIQNVTQWFLKFLFFAIPVKVQNWVQICHFWTLTPWKIAKNQNFKNPRITFLYHPQNYLQTKFQHYWTCRFP